MKDEKVEQLEVYIIQYERKEPGRVGTNSIYSVYKDKYTALGMMYAHFYTVLESRKQNTMNFNELYDVELKSDSMTIRSKKDYMTDYETFKLRKETVN